MADHRLILHIGASKCGSSALQLALSQAPDFTARSGRRHGYTFVEAGSRLFSGAEMVARAKASSLGARASVNVTSAEDVKTRLAPAGPDLTRMIDKGITPILSCEGWARRAEAFSNSGFLEQLGGVHVVFYVRPPVDWLNSAWWQWGVWTPTTLDTYAARQAGQLDWSLQAAQWARVPGVTGVTVALATSDVTAKFFDLIDVPRPGGIRANTGVPAAFLLFLLRNRKYRETAHTPRSEFIAARHLPPARYPTPWVLEPSHVAQVFEALDDMPTRLRRRLSPAEQAAMDADARWWSADAYAARRADDLGQWESPEALAALIGQFTTGLGGDGAAAQSRAADDLAGLSGGALFARADPQIAALLERLFVKERKSLSAARLGVVAARLGGLFR